MNLKCHKALASMNAFVTRLNSKHRGLRFRVAAATRKATAARTSGKQGGCQFEV